MVTSLVTTIEECQHCGQDEAVHDYDTRDHSTEIQCQNCGFYLYDGPKYREDRTIIPDEWIHSETPGVGTARARYRGSLPHISYCLNHTDQLDQWVNRLRVQEKDLEFARVQRWDRISQTTKVLYQFGEVPEISSASPAGEIDETDIPY